MEQDLHVSSDTFNPGHSVPKWEQDYYNARLPAQPTMCTCVPSLPLPPLLPSQLLPSLLGQLTKGHVDLLFNPVFVVRLLCLGVSSVSKAEVCQITGDRTPDWCPRQRKDCWIHMFFVRCRDAFHAFIHRLRVRPSSTSGLLVGCTGKMVWDITPTFLAAAAAHAPWHTGLAPALPAFSCIFILCC